MTPYLYSHENPHAPERSNGRNFWGHPARRGGLSAIRLIVIHTAENAPDLRPPDTGAEAVAAFQARTDRPSSYHRIVDSDSTKLMLPDEAVAFGAVGANTIALHLSFACYARQWAQLPAWWVGAALAGGADVVRAWAAAYRIPLVRLSRGEIRARRRGFVSHADTEAVFGTPGRRSDPGDLFPWSRFLDLARHQEDDMTPKQAQQLEQAASDSAEALRLVKELRDGKMGDRDVDDDLRRIRNTARLTAKTVGAPEDEVGGSIDNAGA